MQADVGRVGVQEFLIDDVVASQLQALGDLAGMRQGKAAQMFRSLLARILQLEGALHHAPRFVLFPALVVR